MSVFVDCRRWSSAPAGGLEYAAGELISSARLGVQSRCMFDKTARGYNDMATPRSGQCGSCGRSFSELSGAGYVAVHSWCPDSGGANTVDVVIGTQGRTRRRDFSTMGEAGLMFQLGKSGEVA